MNTRESPKSAAINNVGALSSGKGSDKPDIKRSESAREASEDDDSWGSDNPIVSEGPEHKKNG